MQTLGVSAAPQMFGSFTAAASTPDSGRPAQTASCRRSKADSCSPPSRLPSSVLAMSSCQAANGSFPPTASLASLLGVSEKEIGSTTWSTALSVAWLVERSPEHEEEWRLVVDKARRWLEDQGEAAMEDRAR